MATLSLEFQGASVTGIVVDSITTTDSARVSVYVSPPLGPLPAPMTAIVGGFWAFGAFADPVPGATYQVRYTVSYTDRPPQQFEFVQSAAPPINPTNQYGKWSDVCNVFGPYNLAAWTNLDNAASAPGGQPNFDWARVQAGGNFAASEINNFFQDSPFVIPIGPINNTIIDWNARIWGIWEYQSRGDKSGAVSREYADKYEEMRRRVYADMALYKGGQVKRMGLIRRYGATPSAPSSQRTVSAPGWPSTP